MSRSAAESILPRLVQQGPWSRQDDTSIQNFGYGRQGRKSKLTSRAGVWSTAPRVRPRSVATFSDFSLLLRRPCLGEKENPIRATIDIALSASVTLHWKFSWCIPPHFFR